MQEDIPKTQKATGLSSEDLSADLHEFRAAVQDLGKLLKKVGKKRMGEVGEEFEQQSEELIRQGRQAIQVLEHRVEQLEKSVERSVRDHPGAWAGGILGVIGFGLILGLLARRHS